MPRELLFERLLPTVGGGGGGGGLVTVIRVEAWAVPPSPLTEII
jgi:hypothetical protein